MTNLTRQELDPATCSQVVARALQKRDAVRVPRWPRRPLLAVLAALFIALVLTPVVLVGYATVRNNRDMSAWRRKFYDASEIDGAELTDKGSRFGVQPGTNGDHCDREAWLVYRTELSPGVIQDHFSPSLRAADGEWWVSPGPEPGTLRVDYLYRFDDGGWDLRCT